MIKQEITQVYNKFFDEMKINQETGHLENTDWKFAAFPHIGSNYLNSPKRVLIVGLDMGSDEKLTKMFQYGEWTKQIEEKDSATHNPHMSGTYITALYFLRNEMNWESYWKNMKLSTSSQKALKENDLPKQNPLSCIALTNFYKFVSENRKKKSGGENRKHQNKLLEEQLLLDEINILKPDIIIFQSKNFAKNNILKQIPKNIKVCVGPHPAYRGKKSPEFFINQINISSK